MGLDAESMADDLEEPIRGWEEHVLVQRVISFSGQKIQHRLSDGNINRCPNRKERGDKPVPLGSKLLNSRS
jgi:hypothetical protein